MGEDGTELTMPGTDALLLFFALLIGHAIADFPLQTDHIAKGKNRHNKSAVPAGQKPVAVWVHILSAHALVHSGAVWLLTGVPGLAFLEAVAHWSIDFLKCDNAFGPHTDQLLHVGCKVAWVLLMAFAGIGVWWL